MSARKVCELYLSFRADRPLERSLLRVPEGQAGVERLQRAAKSARPRPCRMGGEERFEVLLRLGVAESTERAGDRAEGRWNLLIQIGPVIFHCRPCLRPSRRIVEKA